MKSLMILFLLVLSFSNSSAQNSWGITSSLNDCLQQIAEIKENTMAGAVLCSVSINENINMDPWETEIHIPLSVKLNDLNEESFEDVISGYRDSYTLEYGKKFVNGNPIDKSPFVYVRSGITLTSDHQLQISLNTFLNDGVSVLRRIETSERVYIVFKVLVEKVMTDQFDDASSRR